MPTVIYFLLLTLQCITLPSLGLHSHLPFGPFLSSCVKSGSSANHDSRLVCQEQLNYHTCMYMYVRIYMYTTYAYRTWIMRGMCYCCMYWGL